MIRTNLHLEKSFKKVALICIFSPFYLGTEAEKLVELKTSNDTKLNIEVGQAHTFNSLQMKLREREKEVDIDIDMAAANGS